MGINISSNYIPAININTGISVSGILSVSSNSFYDVTNYQTVNITKPEDLLETRLNTPLQVTSYNNDNLTYIASYTFYGTGITSANFSRCTSIGNYAFVSCSKLTTASFSVCTSIGSFAFQSCWSLASVDFPACTIIGDNSFQHCSKLTNINFPVCISIGGYAFQYCVLLTSVSFPACTSIGSYAFYGGGKSLTTVSFPSCISIGNGAFGYWYNLLSLYLMGSSLCSLGGTGAFTSTPIGGYTTSTGGVYGSIYVPASLYNSYIAATNWVTYSSRFVSV